MVSARPSELEVPSSIVGDSNVCFDFLLIRVALALNTRKTERWLRSEHWQKYALTVNYRHALPRQESCFSFYL